MNLFLLTALTMVAFAANSLLNRAALLDGAAGAADFAVLRVLAGALTLMVLARGAGWRALTPTPRRLSMAAGLAIYVLGFSFAYVALPAGLGALLLFGGVQVAMFAGAVLGGEPVPPRRWAGAAIALVGLVWLLWPAGAGAPDLGASVLMIAAALGWGYYSLAGRGAVDPTAETAANFFWAILPAALVWVVAAQGIAPWPAILAVISGAVTSGLGYALWYAVLPQLGASRSAVAQLTVPVIAVLAGALLLAEPLTLRVLIAALAVILGVALSLSARSLPTDRR